MKIRFLYYRMLVLGSGLAMTLAFFAMMPAQAAEIKNLYSADVPVHSQDDSERLEAIRQGLETVLIKVSGRREAPTLPVTATALQQPMQLVSQYRYFPLPDEWQQVVDDQGQYYSQLLHIDYDASAVNKLLRSAALPIWGRARPSTLVWLAVEDWNQRSILSADTMPALREVLVREAARRGVPLLFPLLDLEDQSKLSFADIWGDFQDNILNASQRYQAGVVLVGRMYRQSRAEWQVRWTMYQGDDIQRWTNSAASQNQALSEGLDLAADYFAQRFASLENADGDNRIMVDVGDVRDVDSYARVMEYLQTLDMTTDVQVAEVGRDHVRFSLIVRGAVEGLKQAIKFGETLAPVTEPQPPGSMTATDNPALIGADQDRNAPTLLSYRLLP